MLAWRHHCAARGSGWSRGCGPPSRGRSRRRARPLPAEAGAHLAGRVGEDRAADAIGTVDRVRGPRLIDGEQPGLGVVRTGPGEQVPLARLARPVAPRGRQHDELGAAPAQLRELIGEAHVVAGGEPDGPAVDVDRAHLLAGRDGVGLAAAEGVVEMDLAVGRLLDPATGDEQRVVDPRAILALGGRDLVGGGEHPDDEGHPVPRSHLTHPVGEAPVERLGGGVEPPREGGHRRLRVDDEAGTGVRGPGGPLPERDEVGGRVTGRGPLASGQAKALS